jgi:hypothetical protein
LFTLHETLGDLGALSELCDMPDNQPQKKWLNTEWPWMACLGCNMSIPALGHTLFDEHFQAWGGEDRDFALRQTVEGGLAVNYLPTTAVLHLELADQSILESVNCIGGPTDVVGWLRNRLILREKFPRDVIYPCMKMIRHCQLDLESDRWIFKEQENYDQDEDIILLNFSDWLKRHSAEA